MDQINYLVARAETVMDLASVLDVFQRLQNQDTSALLPVLRNNGRLTDDLLSNIAQSSAQPDNIVAQCLLNFTETDRQFARYLSFGDD